MDFEFDASKSAANKAKHGIDFLEAQVLWVDEGKVTLPGKDYNEARKLVIGRIEDKLWAAVVTMRAGTVRIISVRRAREDEKDVYYGR